jgi:hypothetical protein
MVAVNAATLLYVAAFWLLVSISSVTGSSTTTLRRRETTEERSLQTRGVVTKLVLINARDSTPITDITNGQVINVSGLFGSATPDLSIDAIVTGPVDSVQFGLNNNTKFSVERKAPYSICGNTGTKSNRCTEFGYGTYTVTATPSTNGVVGTSVKVTFTTSNSSAPVAVPMKAPVVAPIQGATFTGLHLMYTASYPTKYVMNLQFGTINVIDLQKLNLPLSRFNVEALVGSNVQSVQFSNGNNETSKPLAYCGNDGDNFHTCDDLVEGATVKISITAFTGPYGGGTKIGTRTTTIRIIRSNSPIAPVPPPVQAPMVVPVSVPVILPVKVPIKVPVATPVKPPVAAPIKVPVVAPVQMPFTAPVKAPVSIPVKAPVSIPVKAPVTIPVEAPVSAPVAVPPTRKCSLPKVRDLRNQRLRHNSQQ